MQPSPSSSIFPQQWASSSSVVESRNKARELSRALERAEADLRAIDRQFQLLDSGLLSEEELRKFAGKSFFPDEAQSPPPRNRYLDAAETRRRRREQDQHRYKRKAATSNVVGISSRSPTRKHHRVSPLQSEDRRPQSPYAAAKSPSMLGTRLAMDNIRSNSRGRNRDRRVEHDSPKTRRRQDQNESQSKHPETFSSRAREEKLERRRMLREDKLSLSVRQADIQKRRALDRELFVAYAARFGPLDGILYATCDLPGLLYEKILSDAVVVVSRWWRAIWPQRALAKHKATTFIQSVYRGARGRRAVKGERNTRKAISHLFNRIAASAFNRWYSQARQSRKTRELMRKIVHGTILRCFDAWRQDVATIKEERRIKMQPVLNKVLHRLLVFTFYPWKIEWEKNVRLKALMRRSLAGRKQYSFEKWQDCVSLIKEERDFLIERRTIAAINIQRLVRGHIDRFCATGGIARRQAVRKREARERRREKKRKAEYEAMIKAIEMEVGRAEEEAKFVLSAVEGALEEMRNMQKQGKGRRELNEKVATYRERVLQQQPKVKLSLKQAKKAVLMREEEDLRRRACARALREFRSKKPPVVSCPECQTGFGHRKDRDRHICQPEIVRALRRGSISIEDVESKLPTGLALVKRDAIADTDGTRPLFTYLHDSSSENDDSEENPTASEQINAKGEVRKDKKSMYQRLLNFYRRARKKGLKEFQDIEKEHQKNRGVWEEVKRRGVEQDVLEGKMQSDESDEDEAKIEEQESEQEVNFSSKPTLFSCFAGSSKSGKDSSSRENELPSDAEQLEIMSEMITKMQMIKTRLLMIGSLEEGHELDRRLRQIDVKARKTLKAEWCDNILYLVKKYSRELDELMFSLVAKSGQISTGKHSDPQAAQRSQFQLQNKFQLALPRVIHQQARLDRERPLAHMAHTMRGVEFEVSVYGHGESLGYMLKFECEGGARGAKYQLVCSLDRCLSMLTAEEVQFLLEHEDLQSLSVQDMMRIYVSLDAIRMYVACLTLRVPIRKKKVRKQIPRKEFEARKANSESPSLNRGSRDEDHAEEKISDKPDEEVFTSDEESVITIITTETIEEETLALESRFVLVLDRKAAEAESGSILEQRAIAEKQVSTRSTGNMLPIIVRRSNAEGTGRGLLHLETDILGIPHKITVSRSQFEITFACVNNLGLEKRLTIDASECASLLKPNEVSDLIRFIKTRDPNINMDSPAVMMRAWTCELALRRYVSFLTLEKPKLESVCHNEPTTSGMKEEEGDSEDTDDDVIAPLIQGEDSAMILVLRRAPPRKFVEGIESEEKYDFETSEKVTSVVHAEVERAEAEADALAAEEGAKSALSIAVKTAQAATEGFNLAMLSNSSQKRVHMTSTQDTDRGYNNIQISSLVHLPKRSAGISKLERTMYKGLSADKRLDVRISYIDLYQEEDQVEELDFSCLDLCQWIIRGSLRGDPHSSYTVELSHEDILQDLRDIMCETKSFSVQSFQNISSNLDVLAAEISSNIWLCNLERHRPWVPRLLLAPLFSIENDSDCQKIDEDDLTADSKDDHLSSESLALNDAKISELTKSSIILLEKNVRLPTCASAMVSSKVLCGEIVVCRHVRTNRWIFQVDNVHGDGHTYYLECSEARCLSLLANVPISPPFGEEVAEILRALGAGSALSSLQNLSRPGTAGGEAADGREGIGLAPYITEEERRTGIPRSDNGLEGVREKLAEVLVKNCLFVKTIEEPSSDGETSRKSLCLSLMPILFEESHVNSSDEVVIKEKSTQTPEKLSSSHSDTIAAVHAPSLSVSSMLLAHQMAKKIYLRRRMVYFAPRLRIGRSYFTVKIIRKEVQTEEDSVLHAANIGTILLEIEAIDARNRSWKLVENEEECLMLVEEVTLSKLTQNIMHSVGTPELEHHDAIRKEQTQQFDSLMPSVIHSTQSASRRSYALIAQRLVFNKHSHRSHHTDEQYGRRKGSRLVLSLYRGSDPKWNLPYTERQYEGLASKSTWRQQTWSGNLPKKCRVKKMVQMKSEKQMERIKKKEHKLHQERMKAFHSESTSLDRHLEHALEKTSHLDAETDEPDTGGDEDGLEEDESQDETSNNLLEKETLVWEDETATVGMRSLHDSQHIEQQTVYMMYAAEFPEHYFGVHRKLDVLGDQRWGAMVDGEHIGEFISQVDAAIAVDQYRLMKQPGLDISKLNFPDAADLSHPKNLESDY